MIDIWNIRKPFELQKTGHMGLLKFANNYADVITEAQLSSALDEAIYNDFTLFHIWQKGLESKLIVPTF